MARARDERPEYVVELDITGVAIVSVQASDAQEAVAKAVERVKPTDVHELDDVEATRVTGPFVSTPRTRKMPSFRRAPRPSKTVSRGGQA